MNSPGRLTRSLQIVMVMSLLRSQICLAQPVPMGAVTTGLISAGFVELNQEQIPLTVTLSGQAMAEKNASIRPLVDGMITDIFYKAGEEVGVGTPLFQIGQESYMASVEVAKADLESAKAAVPSAKETLKRYEALSGTGVAQSEVDKARTELQQAIAAVRSAEAALKTAQINLNRTTIRSPIAGRVSVSEVSIGDLVTAGQSESLTKVIKLDPITVDLAETSSRYLEVRKKLASGELNKGDSIRAELLLENGETYERNGTVESVGSSVSTSTGTLNVRVRFRNPNDLILPGVFLRARLTLGTIDGYLVPQLAAESKADGTLAVWIIDKEKRAKQVFLQPEGTHRSSWIVINGVENGTRVLVDNLDNLRTGAEIDPIDVRIDKNGIIRDLNPSTTKLQQD